MQQYRADVIVVGGGHAGVEAAAAAARMGAETLLITHNLDTIGQMSCNPAIGGIGKSHLVKEVDALGGIMARAIDRAAIHVRVLNASKGPAVRATRMQADRTSYKEAVRQLLDQQENLQLFQQPVDDILLENGRIAGVKTTLGVCFYAPVVVLTVGTFLAGKIHVGDRTQAGGRAGDPAAMGLSERLRALELPVGRLKTGTPPRLDARSIDFTVCEAQPSECHAQRMAYFDAQPVTRLPERHCFITHTNPETHQIIVDNIALSAMYSGNIEGVGPRYCPSIEDKVKRFAERDRHQIFLEPEGLHSREIYPNGISTSLPFDAQVAFLRTIRGLQNVRVTRPGYAIEYDYFDPRALNTNLSVPAVPGLFFAGQINGTTGYEEAAAQGMLAGINAALTVRGDTAWVPRRDEAYLGVLVDDLTTHGTKEPYRMFTSRAEYRLQLRQDNAHWRLTEQGHRLGCVSDARLAHLQAEQQAVAAAQSMLKSQHMQPNTAAAAQFATFSAPIKEATSLEKLLARPEVDYRALMACDTDWQAQALTDADAILQCEAQNQYAGYVRRQQQSIDKLKRYTDLPIPAQFDYSDVTGLSNEICEKLQNARPQTLGQASRIPGVTPAALGILLVVLKKPEVAA